MRKVTKPSGRRAKQRTTNLVRMTKQQRLKENAQRITQAKTIYMAYESAINVLQKMADKSGKVIKPDTYENFKNVVFSQYNTVKKAIKFKDSVYDTRRRFINEYAETIELVSPGRRYIPTPNDIRAILRSEGWQKLAEQEGIVLTAEFLQNSTWWSNHLRTMTNAQISALYGSK